MYVPGFNIEKGYAAGVADKWGSTVVGLERREESGSATSNNTVITRDYGYA